MSLVAGKLRYLGRGLCCEHAVDMNLIQNVEGDDLALETCVLITRYVRDDCYALGRRRVGFDPSCLF